MATTERVERPPSSFFTHNPSSPATFPTPGAQCGAANARASREKRTGPDRTEAAETGRVDQTHQATTTRGFVAKTWRSRGFIRCAAVGVLGACWHCQPSRGRGAAGGWQPPPHRAREGRESREAA